MQGAVGSVLAISRAVIQRHRDGNCRENTQTLTASQFQEREQPFSSSKLRFTNYLCRKSWHGGAVPLGSPAHGIYWHRSMTAPRAPKDGPRLQNPWGFHGITEGFGLEGTLNLVLPLEQLLRHPKWPLLCVRVHCSCLSVCLSVSEKLPCPSILEPLWPQSHLSCTLHVPPVRPVPLTGSSQVSHHRVSDVPVFKII